MKYLGHPKTLGKDLCVRYMFDAGMRVHRDKFGNIIGRIDGEGPSHCHWISHRHRIASSKYDGVLGVLRYWSVDKLKGSLTHPLEVVIFHDEENTMSGSIGYCAENRDIKAFIELHVEQGLS